MIRCVVLDRAGLGLDHAADHVHDVGLLLRRLQERLLGGELFRARDHAVQLLDPVGELLRVPELLLDVLGQRLLDLLRPHAVEVDRGGDVAHHRLDLHPVRLVEKLDDALARLGVLSAMTPCVSVRTAISDLLDRYSKGSRPSAGLTPVI